MQWTLGGQLQHRASNGSVPGVARETDSVDVKVISLRSPGQGGGQQYTGLYFLIHLERPLEVESLDFIISFLCMKNFKVPTA